ncbi:MAG TPA: acetate--CoA ligase family protein [Burkholderiales bacterium]|nr:acetate--CoA ligase family protein [Burkholderiales bacterium]
MKAALDPRSVAVIGASDNPHKVGGRPILYMKRYGFKGKIYPVNPGRAEVQGLQAFPSIEETPEAPELAIVAVAGDEAVRAVEACAARGVKVAVVMASGFGETGEQGKRLQTSMLESARRTGMRLIGPNCQGLANFATGVVANFSTIFNEVEARDGPVAIVSQSGANSQAIYSLLYEKGLGVRHVHATGNEADVTVADLAEAVVADEGVRLLLLYLESVKNPERLAAAAAAARKRGLPIVALKAGRTASGQRAASSHTGALASEDRVVDAFLERHGIWRAADPHQLVAAAELYLAGRKPRSKRLVVVSNSGASCVMAADYAEEKGIPLAAISEGGKSSLRKALPVFAAVDNPIDVTGALLGNPQLLGSVLPIVGADDTSDLLLLAIPVAGTGYDVPRFAKDLCHFSEAFDHAVAMAAPQKAVRDEFTRAGVPTFASERVAMDALAQLADHAALLRRAPVSRKPVAPTLPDGEERCLNEAESLALLARAGLPIVEHRLCRTEEAASAACAEFGEFVMKACSRELAHKTEHGLIAFNTNEFASLREKVAALRASFDGVIVARRAEKGYELALGARLDPQFGPVVLVGDGGVNLEALKDFRLLIPPFVEDDVMRKLGELRIAPLLAGWRGKPPADLPAFARMAVQLGDAMLGWGKAVASVDINPVFVFETGRGALAVDALIERPL